MQETRDKIPDNDTEQRILKAAEKEFMTKGFIGARTTTIASAAGVTHAMFHYYFRTKNKLFERIISEKVSLLKDAMLSSMDDLNAPLKETLRKIISHHLDFIASNPDLPRFLVGEIFSNPERSEIFLDNLKKNASPFISYLQSKIDKEASEGKCRKVDAEMLLLDIVSLNVFPYMATPAVNAALNECMSDPGGFLKRRKEENYETILRKIKP